MKIKKKKKDEARQFENTLIHKENGIRVKKYDFKFLFEKFSLRGSIIADLLLLNFIFY